MNNKTQNNRTRYNALDKPLSFEVPDNVVYKDHGINWRIPERVYNSDTVPYWDEMEENERAIYKLVQDPFLFHVCILGYTNFAVQGEWLNEIASNKYIQLLAPTDFGKSTTVSVSYPLWKYFKECNRRIGIISGSEDQTEASIREIETHLETNGRFHEVFNLRWAHGPIPDKKRIWNKNNKLCYRTRPVGGRDATFFGLGLYGSSWGKRIDELILDDFISPKDFMTRNEDKINSIATQMEEVLFTRLGSDGEIKSIGTFHAAYDTYNYVIENFWKTFKLLKYRALTKKNEDYRIDISEYKERESIAKKRGVEFKVPDFLADGIGASESGYWYDKINEEKFYSLCPERWTVSQLQKRATVMSTIAFCKKYQLSLGLSSDRDINPIWVDRCMQLGDKFIINPDGTNNIPFKFIYKIQGMDLSAGTKRSKKTAIIVVGFTEDGMRIPLWLYNDKIPFPEQKKQLVRKWAMFNSDYVIVESNAYQVSLVQELKADKHIFMELGLPTQALPIRAAFTSSNKNDDIMGIPAIAGLLEHGSLIIPNGNKYTREHFAPLVLELKTYPGITTDTVMATWFIEHYARMNLGYKSKIYLGANPTMKMQEFETVKPPEEIPFIKTLMEQKFHEHTKSHYRFNRGSASKRVRQTFPVFGG